MKKTKYEVWYMRPEFFGNGIFGYDWLVKRNAVPDPQNLGLTHIYLKDVEADSREFVFRTMQGEIWSPNGEARSLILGKGLRHTSMSVGDILIDKVSGSVWLVDVLGFKGIGQRFEKGAA